MPSLLATFGLDASKFKLGLDKAVAEAGKKGPSIEKSLMGTLKQSSIFNWIASPIGAASTAAIGFIGGIIAKVDELRARAKEIKIGSQQTGLSQDQFQSVFNAGQGAGTGTEALPKAILKIAEAQEKVNKGKEGSAQALQAFSDVGITLKEIQTSSYQDLFLKISESMHVAKLSGEQLTAGAELMGKGFESLLPTFQRGFNDPVDQMKKLTDEQITKLNEMNRTVAITKGIWSVAWQEMSTSAMSGLSKQTEGFAGWAVKLSGLGLAAKAYRSFIGESATPDADVAANGKSLQSKVDEQAAKKAQAANADRLTDLKRDKNLKEAATIDEKTAAEERLAKLRAMPVPERLAELKKETAELERQAAILAAKLATEKDAADAPKLAKIRSEIAKNNLQEAELSKQPKANATLSTNANQHIGAYVGGVQDRQLQIAQQSHAALTRIATLTEQLLNQQKNNKADGLWRAGNGVTDWE